MSAIKVAALAADINMEIYGERAEYVVGIMSMVFKVMEYDVFFSQIKSEDGFTHPTSVWIIGDGCACEAKNFQNETVIDIVRGNSMYYSELTFENYTLGNPSPDSAFQLTLRTEGSIGARFQAFGSNCEHLVGVFQRRMLEMIKNIP